MSHFLSFFFFNDTATTEIYTLSLHDALPICSCPSTATSSSGAWPSSRGRGTTSSTGSSASSTTSSSTPPTSAASGSDRKSTRLNSSHANISYAVFCLKKKKIRYPYHDFVRSQ